MAEAMGSRRGMLIFLAAGCWIDISGARPWVLGFVDDTASVDVISPGACPRRPLETKQKGRDVEAAASMQSRRIDESAPGKLSTMAWLPQKPGYAVPACFDDDATAEAARDFQTHVVVVNAAELGLV